MATILWFELRRLFRRVSTWACFSLFTLLGFLAVRRAAAGSGFFHRLAQSGEGLLSADSPYMLFALVHILFYPTLLVTAALFSSGILRDIRHEQFPFLFSCPLRRHAYLGGKFLAALLTTAWCGGGILLGARLAGLHPGPLAEKLCQPHAAAFIRPFLLLLLPNILLAGALAFTLAVLTRRWPAVLAGVTGLMVWGGVAGNLAHATRSFTLGSLLDPFGRLAVRGVTDFWTIAQKNELHVPFGGGFLANRLLWTAVAVCLLIVAWRRFYPNPEAGKTTAPPAAAPRERGPERGLARLLPRPSADFAALVRDELRGLHRSRALWLITLIGLGAVIAAGLMNVGLVRGTVQTYPVTAQLLETVRFPFLTYALFLIAFLAGDLVWRERDHACDELCDALPAGTAIRYGAKLGALAVVLVAALAALMLLGISIQCTKGYFHFEIGLYLQELLGWRLLYFLLLAVLALFLHVLFDRRWPAYIAFLLLVDEGPVLLGLPHHIFTYGSTPPLVRSDMNGMGPFLAGQVSYHLYWICLAVLLAVATILLWVRGRDHGLRRRLAEARRRFGGGLRLTAAAALVGWLGMGGFILHTTVVRHEFADEERTAVRLAHYETTYGAWKDRPQPRITAIDLRLDLYPEQRHVRAAGRLDLVNRTGEAIGELFVEFPHAPQQRSFHLDRGGRLRRDDRRHGVCLYTLDRPLAPGEKTVLSFTLEWRETGFRDQGEETRLMPNGTFLTDRHVLPALGYDSDFQRRLTDNDRRRRLGLPPLSEWPTQESPAARTVNPICRDADRVDFTAVLTTSGDQTAITVGDLVQSWRRDGRNGFCYRTARPVWKYLPFLSARYAVYREQWQGREIAVYHHPAHHWNVGLMARAARESLEYFSREFSPYPLSHLRIVEFPRYELFAEGFSGVVPFSEGLEFIARYDDARRVQEVYRVVAHETAHQWWAHRVLGGRAEGFFLPIEALAQYAAGRMVERRYPPPAAREYAESEMANYFRGRSRRNVVERPLERTVGDNAFVNYQKSYVVMRALAGYCGETTVNAALRRFLAEHADREPPYALARDLTALLTAAAPADCRGPVADWLQDITRYDNALSAARAQSIGGGRFRVEITYAVRKIRSDGLGRETPVAPRDPIDFALLAADGRELYRARRRIDTPGGTFTVETTTKPALAVIDPDAFLLDPNRRDNIAPIR